MPTFTTRHGTPPPSEISALDATLSGTRALALAVALTAVAATLGVGVSWVVERAEDSARATEAVASADAPARLAYSRSSARVSGDFGAP